MTQGFGVVGTSKVRVPGRHRGTPGREVVGRLWPHGEFSVGLRRAGEEYGVERPSIDNCPTDPIPPPEPVQLGLWDDPPALTLPKVLNSHMDKKRPETYGRKGITNYGRKMVRAGAYVLQKRVQNVNLSFLTLTVPPLPPFYGIAVAQGWGVIVNRFLQWLRRRLVAGGVHGWVVSATEMQPGRAAQGDPCCLHLHMVFQGRLSRGHGWVVSRADFKAAWERILGGCVGEKVESDYWPYLKPVKGEAGQYIGKYMSKGADSLGVIAEQYGFDCLPRQWWNMTSDVRDAVNRGIKSGADVGVVLESFIKGYFAGACPTFPGMLFANYIEVEGRKIFVGYSGRLDESEASDARLMVAGLRAERWPVVDK